jgi:hypothetical protein
MIELSEYVPINFISLFILGALLLRRLVRMDGHHWTRVVILTGLLWVPAVYLLLLPYAPASNFPDCTPRDEEHPVFCISE